jgi:hypothetical protein
VARGNGGERQSLDLSEAAQALFDECRMVLPGIQALFGFQLIAVFSQRFTELATREQRLHVAAIALVVLAVGLVMTPAAMHRSMGSRVVTRAFIHASSRLLLASMVPLVLALSIDVYVVASLVTGGSVALVLAGLGFVLLSLLWFAFPRRFRVAP